MYRPYPRDFAKKNRGSHTQNKTKNQVENTRFYLFSKLCCITTTVYIIAKKHSVLPRGTRSHRNQGINTSKTPRVSNSLEAFLRGVWGKAVQPTIILRWCLLFVAQGYPTINHQLDKKKKREKYPEKSITYDGRQSTDTNTTDFQYIAWKRFFVGYEGRRLSLLYNGGVYFRCSINRLRHHHKITRLGQKTKNVFLRRETDRQTRMAFNSPRQDASRDRPTPR